MTRYSGRDLYVSFGGTSLAPIRSIDVNDEANEIDGSAAADTRGVYIAGLVSGDWSAELMDDDTNNTVYTAVAPQTTGTLIVAPQGTATGKKKITYNDVVALKRGRTVPYGDMVVIAASGRLNSAPTLGTY